MDRAVSVSIKTITQLATEVSEGLIMERLRESVLKPEVGVFPEVILAGLRWDPSILKTLDAQDLYAVAEAVTAQIDPPFKAVPEVKILKDIVIAGLRPIDPVFEEPFAEFFE